MSTGTNPGRGTTILVIGIISIVCCGIILGPIAWIMGAGDLKKIASGQISQDAKGLTQAGMICGIIGTIVGILGIIWGVFMGGMAGMMGGAH
jgi:hypothetical protein